MIPHQWYVVLESKQVGKKPIGVLRLGEKMVFWRDEAGRVVCFHDRCVHRGVQLSQGQVIGGRLQCPFHGFEYDPSGRVMAIPANSRAAPVPEVFRVPRYPTYEAHGFIWVWWGENPPPDLEPPRFFPDLDETFVYATIVDPWHAHYSRVIENQLDVVHVPFVHHNTIGRGVGTVVDGPGLQWVEDDLFYIYVFNRPENGTLARKPSQVTVPPTDREFKLEFRFPNLWQNYINRKVRIVAAFVPVDESRTLLYLRFYQSFLPVPVLGKLVAWAAMPFNRLVAHQDRRVVKTHQPQPSGLRIGERLIPGDQPIIEYRRRVEELKEAARRPGVGIY